VKAKDKSGSDVEPVAVTPATPRMTWDLEPFERFFAGWPDWMPFRRFLPEWTGAQVLHVDEFRRDGDLVIRAEIPGMDPAKDVDVTVADGMLTIRAERREQTDETDKPGYVRRELRYGSFFRSLPMPRGVTEADVTASYKDGILEIHVPEPAAPESRKVEIATS
jgi:HSP20 family protein